MSIKNLTSESTENYWRQIHELKSKINEADAILIGAGAGLSTSAGFIYSGERFTRYFQDFSDKYGFNDMYSGGFFPFTTTEEFWAYWSRFIFYNRYENSLNSVYKDLLAVLKEKKYFVLTTNVDHQFQKNGFDKENLFYTQGDYGLFQCSTPCHDTTYDNEEVIRNMVKEQKNMRVPQFLLPNCPSCGKPMTMNLRSDENFVEDIGWHFAASRYNEFLKQNSNKRLLLIEIGVGFNTPGIIKYPFWKLTALNDKACYTNINIEYSVCPKEIIEQSLLIKADISCVLRDLNMS